MAHEHFKWRVVSDTGPWRQKKGSLLRWEMTEDYAAKWQASNPQTIIEKVPGSGYVRSSHGSTEYFIDKPR